MSVTRPVTITLLAVSLLTACASDDTPSTEAADVALSARDRSALTEAVRHDPLTPDLRAACPPSRGDRLCVALRSAEEHATTDALDGARAAARDRVALGPRAEALRDPAVKYWIRERVHALTALHDVAGMSAPAAAPPDFTTSVDAHFRAQYPLYEPSSFRLGHGYLPPSPTGGTCDGRKEALVVFPGVIRLPTKKELEVQINAVRAALPCLVVVRVDTGSFVDVESNARKGREAVARVDAEVGRVPLHFLGYSQGVTNALRTVASDPKIAARTRSVVSISPAAHGSEAADTLLRALRLYTDRPTAGCDEMWPGARDLCKQVARRELAPVASFMQAILERMGASFDDVAGSTVGEWLARHVDGLRSLTTGGTEAFWTENGARLPRDAAYLTFRSVIADEDADLPQSNWLSYQVLFRSSATAPWNDMQVRLANQFLGRDVAAGEVVGRVANGNHWRWALTSSDVPERLMPARMFAGVPREALFVAHYETLAELGLVTAGGTR